MTAFTIRPANLPDDLPRIAELINLSRSIPVTADEVGDAWRVLPEGTHIHRALAVNAAGFGLGMAFVYHMPMFQEGHWTLKVQVDPGHTGAGIGTALLAEMEAFAREHGLTAINTSVREGEDAALAWALRRGYGQTGHLFESALAPAAFDESRFGGVLERLEAEGIRFASLADLPGEAWERKLWAMEQKASPDNPLYDLKEPIPFEQWRKWSLEEPGVTPDQYFVALAGEEVIGTTVLQANEINRDLYTSWTCVDREYRGRSIALALKLVSIRKARVMGAPYMRTNNHSANASMLAVNQKLGYVPAPGYFLLSKEVSPA